MKRALLVICCIFSAFGFSQKKKPSAAKVLHYKTDDLTKVNDSVAALIPFKLNGKFGFQNQKGKKVIAPVYSNVGFFTEDCNLLHSDNANARKFGGNDYASVRLNGEDFRIDQKGRKVYRFKDSDVGKCPSTFKKQLFHGYMKNGFYGVIEDARFQNPEDYRQYTIYPQYEYIHILEGDDLKNPMIIASANNRFGVIDVYNNVVIPFEYTDIKRNYSWKLGRLFEVTKDGSNYFYVDNKNRKY